MTWSTDSHFPFVGASRELGRLAPLEFLRFSFVHRVGLAEGEDHALELQHALPRQGKLGQVRLPTNAGRGGGQARWISSSLRIMWSSAG